MMLKKIVDALNARKELVGWSLRHILTREAQVYLIGQKVESQRLAGQERFRIEVFRHNTGADGSAGMGSGEVTLLSNGDVESAIDKAALVAGLVTNPVHTLPAPAPIPDVPLLDEAVKRDPLGALDKVTQELLSAGSRLGDVRMTSAEGFADVTSIHHVNSRGIDAEQEMSNVSLEFVLQSRKGEREVETLREWARRRVSDLNLQEEISNTARVTRDLLEAGSPPAWQGPVVLRGQVLADFVSGEKLVAGSLETLSNAGTKYAQVSNWEVGKPVFKGEVTGDPLTVWANRTIPFGITSNRFDEEGLPAQRVELIRDNNLVTFAASQRYADYLKLAPTGAFGTLELPAGKWESSALLDEPYVEIALFSWFNPNNITGDFACEIRLGYVVENGVRKPFRGGQLIGNVLDALANVRWGKETALLGHYLGPTMARFGNLKVAGE
jgi:predicted Zn-dependent protease